MASTRERNGRFIGLYRDSTGKQKSAGTFAKESEALKAAQAFEAVEKQGQNAKHVLKPRKQIKVYPQTRQGSPTLAAYGPKWLEGQINLEATTKATYGNSVRRIIAHLGQVALADLTKDHVTTFFATLQDSDLSYSAVGQALTVFRGICQSAVAEGFTSHDPTAGIVLRKKKTVEEMRILTPAEYRKLYDAIDDRYKLFIRTLVSTGLRWGECIALRASDIVRTHEGYVIRVRRVITEIAGKREERAYGKSIHASRDVSIDQELATALQAAGSDGGLIFTAPRGSFLNRANFHKFWKDAQRATGIEVRIHDLRHTHASWLVNGDCDLVTVRDRLGHADIKITSKYLHKVPGNEDRAVAAMRKAMAA